MQLQCAHCPYISKSLVIDKDKALADIMLDFSKHLSTFHASKNPSLSTPFKSWMQDVTILTQVAPTVIMLAKHSKLLDNFDADDFVQQKFSELIDQIQDYLGVEVFDNKPNPDTGSKNTQAEKGKESEVLLNNSSDLSLPQMH